MDATTSHYAGLVEIAARLRTGSISSVELTTHLLDRIARLDPQLHAYRLVTAEHALAQAEQADAALAGGHVLGPLHGVPIAVKDVLGTHAVPTSDGARLPPEGTHGGDATAVARATEAGAVVLGTLQTTEGSWLEHHPTYVMPVNPWDPDDWPGTSAIGAGVAVAAGLCFAALTTDTGGSIRLPAGSNALTGLKPTFGRVSRHGSFPLAETFDHIGPICRSAADVAAVLRVIAGRDPRDPTALAAATPDYRAVLDADLAGLRIGVDAEYNGAGVDDDVVGALGDAVEVFGTLGAEIASVTMPSGDLTATWTSIAGVEAALSHAADFPMRSGDYGPLGRLLAHAQSISGVEVVLAQRARAAFVQALDAVFETVDVLLVPTQPCAEFSYADHDRMLKKSGTLDELVRFVVPYNVSGHPALALPAGFTAGGFPISVQLVSRTLAESLLLRTAHAYQQVTDWHTRRPTI